MDKNKKVTLVAGAVLMLLLAVALGSSAAIAGSRVLGSSDDKQAVIDDAAAELGVEPDALEKALEQALKNRVQDAVDAGELTEEQGVELKERIESEAAPFLGGFGRFGGFGGDRGPRHVGHHAGLGAAASYLGLTEDALREQLRDGKTLAAVAKAEGKSVDGLVQAMVNAAKKELDASVAADRLTRERADMIEEDLEERTTALVNGEHRRGPFGPNRRSDDGGHPGIHPFFSGPRA